MKAIKGYLNIEQLTEVIQATSSGRACGFYCQHKCEYRNDVNACYDYMETQKDFACHKGDEDASRLYAEYIIELYNNGFHLL